MSIPEGLKQSILLRSKRRCPLCFVSGKTEPQPGSIVHIDSDSSKNDLDNLVFLCSEHHRQLDQGSAITTDALRKARAELYRAMLSEEPDTSRGRRPWQSYEGRVVELMRSAMSHSLGDSFNLNTNSLVAARSGVSHEVDIEVTFNIAGLVYRTIFDIKYRRTKIGVEDVLQFAAVAEDIGANKVVIVSNSGFSNAASRLARSKGITLFHVAEDAASMEGLSAAQE